MPSLFDRSQVETVIERRRLSELVRRFNAGGAGGLSKTPHPFFGKLTSKEWDQLTCNHLDHHLRQFGV